MQTQLQIAWEHIEPSDFLKRRIEYSEAEIDAGATDSACVAQPSESTIAHAARITASNFMALRPD